MPNCQHCQSEFEITSADCDFYSKMHVPEPIICPQCSWRQQLAFRNEKTLSFRACDLCKKQTLSTYPSDSPYTIYCIPCWKSDNWNPLDYAKEYQSGHPFFDQLNELFQSVPRPALFHVGENPDCQYANYLFRSSKVYLGFSIVESENVYYSRNIDRSHDIVDCLNCVQCELLYECVDCQNCTRGSHLHNSESCADCSWCYDCVDCQDCFGCIGLRHKKYCWLNEQLTEKEFKQRWPKRGQETQRARECIARGIHRHARLINCESCTGDYLRNCNDCLNCFYGRDAEHCANLYRFVGSMKDARTGSYIGIDSELLYNCMATNRSRNLRCAMFSSMNTDSDYIFDCESCDNCFGSTALKHKQFCILNKQYSEAEYRMLRAKIVEQMRTEQIYGRFFPGALSTFGYNETLASELFPLSKDEAIKLGFKWRDNIPKLVGVKTIRHSNIPRRITEVPDTITKEVLVCEVCSKNYKITPYELQHYRKLDIPIPRKCFECRLSARMVSQNPPKLWPRSCARSGCKNTFLTNYAPNRPEVVYCDSCYRSVVY